MQSLLAHSGGLGWDELLVYAGPLVIFLFLLWRAARSSHEREGDSADADSADADSADSERR